MEFFTVFNRPPNDGVNFVLPSKTEQAHKDDYDINRLIKRATRTGVLATADMIREVYYGDFSEIEDNFDAHLKIKEAEDHFMALPSEVRAYFDNDPRKLLNSLHDNSEGNIKKLVELGLVHEKQLSVDEPQQQQQQ